MATDRDTATTLTSILESPFDKLWQPLNRGADSSWGALLNENFETIVRTFVHLDDRITLNAENIEDNELLAGEGVARSLQNQSSIGDINSTISDIVTDLTDVRDEVADSRGNLPTLDDRLDISFDDDGIRKANVIMSGIFTANYISKDVVYDGNQSIKIITSLMDPNEIYGDGTGYGIVSSAATQDDEVDNVCHLIDVNSNDVLLKNGQKVYGRLIYSGGDVELRTYYIDEGGSQLAYVMPSGTSVKAYIPKIFDYYTTPKINIQRNKAQNTPKATSDEYGIVRMGSGNELDADTVDGIHASTVRLSGVLYPLDESGRIPAEAVHIYNGSINNNLESEAPSYLKTRIGEVHKNIDDYLSCYGVYASGYLFARVADGDCNGQFTKIISDLEAEIDQNTTDISTLQTEVEINISGISNIEHVLLPGLDDDLRDYTDGALVVHSSDADAHHDQYSNGVVITPDGVVSPSGEFVHLLADFLDVGEIVAATQTTLYEQNAYIADRFIELGVIDSSMYPSGVIVNREIVSGLIKSDEYICGIAFHAPTEVTDISGIVYQVDDSITLLRYNKSNTAFEYAVNWSQPPSGLPDPNNFYSLRGAVGNSQTLLVLDNGQPGVNCDFNNISDAVNDISSMGGKIQVREGDYTGESIALPSGILMEGCGVLTRIGNVTISGNSNMMTKLQANSVTLVSGVHYNSINFNWIDDDIYDYSQESDNVQFANIPV